MHDLACKTMEDLCWDNWHGDLQVCDADEDLKDDGDDGDDCDYDMHMIVYDMVNMLSYFVNVMMNVF